MKKNKFSEFFKGKGYYVLLFIGVIAIAAVAFVGSQLSSNDIPEDQQYVDLNDTEDNTAVGENDTQVAENNNPVSDEVANNGSNSTEDTAVTNDADNEEVASNDAELEGYAATTDSTEQASADNTVEDAVETAGNAVEPDNTDALEALSFNTEGGLLWPVQGNVLIDYSMDHTTYFATLMQYKCNPAIIIDAEVGQEVLAATDGIVTAIDADNEETGYTITISIGDDYDLVYGQLDKDSVSLKVGDSVKEGDVIGTIAEPTKYYSVEGSNLYFELSQNDASVNPMLYLR